MINDISWAKIPLPDDILRLKNSGCIESAKAAIGHMLSGYLPDCMRKRLELEKEIIGILDENEYPYKKQEAAELLSWTFSDVTEGELDELVRSSVADWIYINGEIHFHKLFLDNIIKTRPDYQMRLKAREEDDAGILRQKMLNDNVSYMKEHGSRKAKIVIRASIRINKESERVGEMVRVHIPIPRKCRQVKDFKILEASPEITAIAPEDAEQRTLCFETELKPDQEFYVRYSYLNSVDYVEVDPEKAAAAQPEFYKEEQAPHILFTPFLKEILEEIREGEDNPALVARKIYDFITTRVKYSFVREYAGLDNISEYAAKNLKGDCGVQAILFITLCRMAGIPARWQSGLHASQVYTGCHDWAEFYIEPYGWLYADPSFGGSAYRMGQVERWNYYFGNLDIYRMAANGGIQSEFIPPRKYFRADPIDNQRGEVEYEDRGLSFLEFQAKQVTELIEDWQDKTDE
ncbi:transglutaminase-like domain-containing protein [Lacrimispora sp.]|uniref:transglutaminase-like domain-containing protein n=1 Tax=Lacrimispora sp. TaxID=2719234 RepID=UPI0028AA8857|nr:transglutaminase domain-containing protein [Lacrimispora sp.]